MTDIIKALEAVAEEIESHSAPMSPGVAGSIVRKHAIHHSALATYRASVDAVELPEPYGSVWVDEFDGGCFAYWHEVRARNSKPVYDATTVRRLIAEAVARERESCAVTAWSTGMDLHMKSFDAREIGSKCAAAIRARGGE